MFLSVWTLLALIPILAFSILAFQRLQAFISRRAVFNRLKARFGFHDEKTIFHPEPSIAGRLDGHTVSVTFMRLENVPLFHIGLKSGRLLPRPLRMAKGEDFSLDKFNPPSALSLDVDDFNALNESIGRPVMTGDVVELVTGIQDHAFSFSVFNNEVSISILQKNAAAGSVAALVENAAGLASRLIEIGRDVDLAVHALCVKVRMRLQHDERRSALRLLAWKYRDHPLARETFAYITENADFELGLSAAEALGIDLISYVKDSLRRLILSDKIKAVRIFSDRKVAGGIDFLLGYFKEARETTVRREIIAVLAEEHDQRAYDLTLAALSDRSADVAAAAVEVLAESGKKDAIAPLAKIIADPSASSLLRERARVVSTAICRRLGLSMAGWVSLAGGEAAEGGLSKAEE